MIIGLHHAQITIPKGREAEARAFYCDLLGLAETPKPDSLAGRGGFWLMVGDCSVHVGTEDGVERRRTKAHLAYEVTDVARWRTVLEEAGVPTVDEPLIPGYDRFHCHDPFGNRFELIQRVG
ncbi:MAG: VOC family protein [bacterium]